MSIRHLIWVVAALLCGSQAATAEVSPEELLKAIVTIQASVPADARTAASLGTERQGNGVVIDSKGHILTIGYLVLEAESITVPVADGESTRAVFVGYDPDTGFAIIRAEPPLPVRPMEFGDSSTLKEGDPVLAAGPGGPDAVQGVRVISLREFAGYWEYLLEHAIYTVPPYSDYGGAALIGADGRLLGIGSIFTRLTLADFGTVSCNMFVPVDLLKPILPDLIAFGRRTGPPRPWLGVQVEESHGRVVVIRISPDSPAEQAEIQPGDIILTVNKNEVKGLADFYRKIYALGPAGVDVPLGVLQGIQIHDITIRSADRHGYMRLKPGR